MMLLAESWTLKSLLGSGSEASEEARKSDNDKALPLTLPLPRKE